MTTKTDIQKTPAKQPQKAAGNSVFRHLGSTGKELDLETGYSYFGARYLDNVLSTAWLSVDPMSDKYPSISPYAYCSWNPVKLVDPDGKDVYINGDGADQATQQLSTKGLNVFRDEKTGKLSCIETGKKLSKRDMALRKAINNDKIIVCVDATSNPRVPYSDNFTLINDQLCGQMLGADFLKEEYESKELVYAKTHQLVNPTICENRDKSYDVPIGTSLVHEITESFQAGILCLKGQRPIKPCFNVIDGKEIDMPCHEYWTAHKNATLQAKAYRERLDEVFSKMIETIYGKTPQYQINPITF